MLSICILTKNNQDQLAKLFPTMQFAQEIIIVDDDSSDNTKNIAKAHHCRYYSRKLKRDFSAQRNFALSKAKYTWVLFIDPDEQITQKLAQEIISTIQNPKFSGYSLKRQDILFGKTLRYGETSQVRLVRLARKDAGKWHRAVHEIWQVSPIGELEHPLVHHPHTSIQPFIQKINYYSSIEAEYRLSQKQIPPFWQIVVYPLGKFIYNYFIKLGVLDGFEGFIMASMMSFHSFFVRTKTYLGKP